MSASTTKERARGRWRELLPAFGIDESFLRGRNCPCPICGGKDRFRFIDRRGQERDGMWVCNQCCPTPRPAIDLVMAFTGKPFSEAARMIDAIIVGSPPPPRRQPPPSRAIYGAGYAARVWSRGVPVRRGDPVDRYLSSRGVGMDLYPPVLRCSLLDWYRDDDNPIHIRLPAMFALVHDGNGHPVAVHRTFLAVGGSGKADVASPRKAAGQLGSSPTIRLSPPAPTLGIAEGIETALSAAKLFEVPTWSVIAANGIRGFEPPLECRRLIVFADHDHHGVGQRAAEELAKRLIIHVEIRFPDQPGSDWNDVLRKSGR
jgi:putative DNA primase/helicase